MTGPGDKPAARSRPMQAGQQEAGVKERSRGIDDALGRMGSKLAERRRKTAETRDRDARPDRDRPRRDLDREF